MPNSIALIGLDIAKSVFQVHAATKEGRPVTRRKLKRDEVAEYFRCLSPCVVGLEACPGSHYWARVIRSFGHDVKLWPVALLGLARHAFATGRSERWRMIGSAIF